MRDLELMDLKSIQRSIINSHSPGANVRAKKRVNLYLCDKTNLGKLYREKLLGKMNV